MRHFVLNKPRGCICSRRDPEGRPTVYDHVPAHYPPLPHVGRLDFNTEGLLLFTADGRLSRALLDADFADRPPDAPPVEKVYHVKVRGLSGPDDPRLRGMEAPLVYRRGDESRPARVRWLEPRARSAWVEVILDEGRHHQVRELCARAGLQIVKLRRVRLGPLELGDLKLRWCRPLTDDEIAACYAAALPGEAVPEA